MLKLVLTWSDSESTPTNRYITLTDKDSSYAQRSIRAQICMCTDLYVYRSVRAQIFTCTDLYVHRSVRVQIFTCTDLYVCTHPHCQATMPTVTMIITTTTTTATMTPIMIGNGAVDGAAGKMITSEQEC